jgi:predicted component of type VI protein secretion system
LKRSIEKYEPRLKDVYVDMKYNSKEELVTLFINGKLNNEKQNDYRHVISFLVW